MKDEMRKRRKGKTVAYFKASDLSQQFPGGSEEGHYEHYLVQRTFG
jgi:hypothetical protein